MDTIAAHVGAPRSRTNHFEARLRSRRARALDHGGRLDRHVEAASVSSCARTPVPQPTSSTGPSRIPCFARIARTPLAEAREKSLKPAWWM